MMTHLAKTLKTIRPQWLRSEKGVALIEVAFVAPFLVFLSVGIVDFGQAWARQMALTNAVRAGMQFALVHKPAQEETVDVENAVTAAAPEDYEDTPAIRFYCECPGEGEVLCTATCAGGGTREVLMEISVSEDYELLFNYPGIGGNLTLGDTRIVRLG